MRFFRLLIVAMGFCMLICNPALPQDNSAGINKALNFPSSFFNEVYRQTEKYLQRLTKRGQKSQRIPCKTNSAGAQHLFANRQERYQQFANKIKSITPGPDETLRMEETQKSIALLQKEATKRSIVQKD